MCLILVAWQVPGRHALIVAANRDEFHGRPAAPAAFWEDEPGILAGRDLEARGTWMGISRGGRFAAVTNYRGGTEPRAERSRGSLVSAFLADGQTPRQPPRQPPAQYIDEVRTKAASYSGFNLLVGDGKELWWLSNRDGTPRRLEPGIYGLGNALLDSPDVEPRKRRFEDALAPGAAVEPLFSVLAEARIVDPRYGTRCSTVYFGGRYVERTFSPDGTEQDTLHYEL
ncbi:MAG TPA: NRDE family protein [Burkholderiales bacterium]|nr:NRDE family protein [Burkholderiales bacterium]